MPSSVFFWGGGGIGCLRPIGFTIERYEESSASFAVLTVQTVLAVLTVRFPVHVIRPDCSEGEVQRDLPKLHNDGVVGSCSRTVNFLVSLMTNRGIGHALTSTRQSYRTSLLPHAPSNLLHLIIANHPCTIGNANHRFTP